jgi:hypothetical protein
MRGEEGGSAQELASIDADYGAGIQLNRPLPFGKMWAGYNLALMKVEIRMEKYKLTFEGWDGGSSNFDIKEVAIFRVSTGPIIFPVSIQMVRTLFSMLTTGTPGLSQPELRKAMLVLALPRLRARLNHFDAPTGSGGKILITETFTSDHADLFSREIPVKCQFQERTVVGLICRAAAPNDKLNGKTTSAICAACDLPREVLRCTKLQHPEVIGIESSSVVHRLVASAFCDLRTTSPVHRECIPGGNSCWQQEIDNSEKIGEIAEDIAERVVDELQYLTLGFRQAFGHALVRINDPRSVSQILTPCRTQEEFTTKVACLADLFNNLDLSNFDKEIKDDVKGPLNRLEFFLRGRQIPLDERPIRTLKFIVSIRNSFPIHSGNTEFLAACQELQVEYPPTAWEEAWAVVLHKTWRSLRTLRVALPVNP